MVLFDTKHVISLLMIAATAVRSINAWSPSMEIRSKMSSSRPETHLRADYSEYNYNDGRYYPYDSRYNNGDNYNGYNNGYNQDQGYGYSNVNYPASANYNEQSSGLSRWNNSPMQYNSRDAYGPLSDTPLLEALTQSLFSAIDFSKDLDAAIDRIMTPLIKRSARGRTGILRKGTNDLMRRQVPVGTDMEQLFDQALSILKYDSYVNDELLQTYTSKPIDIGKDGRSVFSQTSSSRMSIVDRKLKQRHLTKIGVSLNYYPWEMWVVAENGVLQNLVLVNPESNYEYVVEGYNDFNNNRYLAGANDFVDAEILDKNRYGYNDSQYESSLVNYDGRSGYGRSDYGRKDFENVPFDGRLV